jgi:N-acyl homoserine lactone hydrolase
MPRLHSCLALIAAMSSLASCAHVPEKPELKLYAFDCGQMVTNGIRAANPCFLIRHPQGDLLWDAGLPESMAGKGEVSIGNVRITLTSRLSDMLAQLQMTPDDVEFLSLSHSHFDHIGNVGLFRNATWIVDTDERAWAFRPAARTMSSFTTVGALENVRTQTIEDDGDYDVFEDGTVMIVQTPGHTPGHCALLLRLSESGVVLLAGDIWTTKDAQSTRNKSVQEQQSAEKVERLATAGGARLVRQHVLEDFEALPRFPDFLR